MEKLFCPYPTDAKVSGTGPSDATQELQSEGTDWEAATRLPVRLLGKTFT